MVINGHLARSLPLYFALITCRARRGRDDPPLLTFFSLVIGVARRPWSRRVRYRIPLTDWHLQLTPTALAEVISGRKAEPSGRAARHVRSACLCHLEPKISLVGCLFGSKTGVVAAP